jgi:hypothetical protein
MKPCCDSLHVTVFGSKFGRDFGDCGLVGTTAMAPPWCFSLLYHHSVGEEERLASSDGFWTVWINP